MVIAPGAGKRDWRRGLSINLSEVRERGGHGASRSVGKVRAQNDDHGAACGPSKTLWHSPRGLSIASYDLGAGHPVFGLLSLASGKERVPSQAKWG